MYTTMHKLIEIKAGEPVTLAFSVTDESGAAVTVDGGSAVYRLARRAGMPALLTVTESGEDPEGSVTLDGSVITVTFATESLAESGAAMTGDFFGQLTLTLDAESHVVAEGPLTIGPVILPPIS